MAQDADTAPELSGSPTTASKPATRDESCRSPFQRSPEVPRLCGRPSVPKEGRTTPELTQPPGHHQIARSQNLSLASALNAMLKEHRLLPADSE